MPIRSIDFQTIIPKAPEVQKLKHMEEINPQNNNAINIHKQQEQNSKELKKVNETKKTFDGKIKRDNPRKQQSDDRNQDDQDEDKKKKNKKQSIDIKI